MEKINIRGIPFDNVTKEEATALIIKRLEDGVRTVVVTPNSEIVQSCIEDEEMMRIVTSADVILPDGIGVIKAAKILETPLKEKVPGVEIGEALFKELAATEHTFFILGGKPEDGTAPSVASEAAEKMAEKYGCKFAGHHHGYFMAEDGSSERVISEINSSGADVLFVCLGSPAQERWIAENADRLDHVRLAMALGGSVDIYAERVHRAPEIFIKTGLEWLWRLIRQPWRIGRMMKLPKFYLGMKKYKKNKDKQGAF